MMRQDIQATRDVLVDPKPDARGNVLAMALIDGGRRIALTFNAN
jgi:hypothetical protein